MTNICPSCGGRMHRDASTCDKCCDRSGENNGNWRGGKSKNHYAYKLIQQERWPEHDNARRIVYHAKKSGRLVQCPCEICGEEKTHAHHDDYSKPLEVRWLCEKHHREYHDNIRKSNNNIEETASRTV